MGAQGEAEGSRAGLIPGLRWVAGLIAMQQCLTMVQPAFGFRGSRFDAQYSLNSSCQSMQLNMGSTWYKSDAGWLPWTQAA